MARNLALPFALCLFSLCFSGTDWVNTGKDPAYPIDLYFVGVGLSEKGMDAAKQSAMVEVKKQISVSVNATVLDEMSSQTVAGREQSSSKSESRARLTTSGDVQGIQVVQTTQKGKLFYALAILDKGNFTSNCKHRIAELKSEMKNAMDGAKADISAGKMGAAFKKLSLARKNIGLVLAQRTLLSAASAVTDAEKLDYSDGDIAALYEKCVSAIKLTKSGGDNQEIAVGMVPDAPFAVTLTAENFPINGVWIILRDEGNKSVMEKVTGEDGRAEFSLGENANTSVGSHKYTAEISLSVSGNLSKLLKSQSQAFSYKVISNPCYAAITVKVTGPLEKDKAELLDKTVKMLSKYDVKQDSSAPYELQVGLDAKESGNVQGLSESRTFVKSDVTLHFALLEGGKESVVFEKKAKGMGSTLTASVGQALSNAGIKTDIKLILDKICGPGADTPKKKIAVFPFKNTTGYADWYNAADALADMVITKLINSRRFDVVERSMLSKIMEEKSLGMSGVVEQSEAVQTAVMAGAELVMVGSASVAGGKIEVDARIIDAGTGVAKCAMNSSGFALSDLRALADDVVKKIPALK